GRVDDCFRLSRAPGKPAFHGPSAIHVQDGLRHGGRRLAMSKSVRALLICPRYDPHSFWSFEGAVEVLGAKYPTSPLGLITLAALLPADWDLKLVDCNTEDLTDDHLAWADLAMIGGMMAQQKDTLRLIDQCRTHNVPVVIGGPDASSSPHVYAHADF